MLNRKRLTFIVLLFLSVLSVRFLPGCGEGLDILTGGSSDGGGTPVVDWTLYDYRRMVTIQENSTTDLSGYQVKLSLNNTNFSFANADSSGNDLRFSYNGTSLSYWIESWNAVGEIAVVWVKIPSIPSGGETIIYMYYGKSGETAASNFDNTFTKESGFSGLAAQWHMDEGSGTSIDDSSANSNTGTFSGVTWVNPAADGGKWYDRTDIGFSTGESIQTNASTNYIVVSDNNTINPSAKITILLWFKAVSVTSGYLISKGNIVDSNLVYSVFLNAGRVLFYSSDDGVSFNSLQNDGSTVSTGQWYHLAAVYDGSVPTQKLYINGAARGGNVPSFSTLFDSSSDLIICNQKAGASNYFSGIIDEVSIYDTALTAAQIEYHSRRSKYVNPPPTYTIGGELLN